jgi:DNA-binding NarL/FixJ family response regulator
VAPVTSPDTFAVATEEQLHAKEIRIALGQFGTLVGRGLIDVLREDTSLRLIGRDLDRPGLEHILAEQKPEIAILDETSATEPSLLASLLVAQPEIGLIVMAHHPSRGYAAQMLAAGATCLSKDASAADIYATVHLAAEGHHMLTLSAEPHGRRRGRGALTPRQAEILRYIRLGQSYPTIAHTLGISVETVRTHATQVRRKLGARKLDLVGLQDLAYRGERSR